MCDRCGDIKALESKEDRRYEEYLRQVTDYEVTKVETKSLLKAIHHRMDTQTVAQEKLSSALMEHMLDEEVHHLSVASHMARTNELLEHVATKEEVSVQAGRINTGYKLAGVIFLIVITVGSVMTHYIKQDIISHVKESNVKD